MWTDSKERGHGMENLYHEIVIDGKTIDSNCIFRGLGTVANNISSRLLIDYKYKNPDVYWEILKLLFEKKYGAGLSHIKIINDEETVFFFEDENCFGEYDGKQNDIFRGAGFMLASDARKINPEITIELFVSSQPQWVKKVFGSSKTEGFEAKYKYLKKVVDTLYNVYEIKPDYVNVEENETDAEWIIYLRNRFDNEKSREIDYSKIKLVVSDKHFTGNLVGEMLKNRKLRNAVEAIGIYSDLEDENNVKLLCEKYHKEIWHLDIEASENAYSNNTESKKSLATITNKILNDCFANKIAMYEYNNAVCAYYEGLDRSLNSLVSANSPWSGFYNINMGLWGAAHITHFAEKGWKYVGSVLSDDLKNTRKTSCVALASDDGHYSVIFSNSDDKPQKYSICIRNISKAEEFVHCVETRISDNYDDYQTNIFNVADKIIPVRKPYGFCYNLDVKPHSVMTCTTLSVDHINGADTVKIPQIENGVFMLPYTDDFDYDVEFLASGGDIPLYTNDRCGKFRIVWDNEQSVLAQVESENIIPENRNISFPVTDFGDDRWADYSVKSDVKFGSMDSDNYIGIGLRYDSVCGDTGEYGYQLRIYPDNRWQLKYMNEILAEDVSNVIKRHDWNRLKISAEGCQIKCSINKNIICEYTASDNAVVSGRAVFYSGYYRNLFGNLSIAPVIGGLSYSEHHDCMSEEFDYFGQWRKNTHESYEFSECTSVESTKEGDSFEFDFNGKAIALIGRADDLRLKIEIDDKIMTAGMKIDERGCRQVFYMKRGLEDSLHHMKLTVLSGNLKFDSAVTFYQVHNKSVYKPIVAAKAASNRKADKKVLKKSVLIAGIGVAAVSAGTVLITSAVRKKQKRKNN